MTLNKVQKACLDFGGITLGANGKSVAFKHGYQVSMEKPTMHIALSDITEGLLEWFLAKARELGTCVGLWKDGSDGLYDIDLSINIIKLEDAIAFGKANHQKAIYDWERRCEIKLSY